MISRDDGSIVAGAWLGGWASSLERKGLVQ